MVPAGRRGQAGAMDTTESLHRWEWEGGAVPEAPPTPSRVVVCGIDGSSDAENAARIAVQLASLAGARLALVTVGQVPMVHGAAAVPGARRELRTSTLEAAAELLSQTAKALGNRVPIDCHLELGDPVHGLVEVALRTNALAVVVGTRGLGALRTAVVGSVAAGLCRHSPCPVVVVPPADAAKWRRAPRATPLARSTHDAVTPALGARLR